MSSCLIHGERMKIRQCSSSAGVHPLPPHRLHIPCPLTYPLFQTSSACQLYAVPWFQQQTLLQYRTNRVFRFRFSMSLIVSPRRLGWDSEEGGTLFSETRLATHSENTLRFGASSFQAVGYSLRVFLVLSRPVLSWACGRTESIYGAYSVSHRVLLLKLE